MQLALVALVLTVLSVLAPASAAERTSIHPAIAAAVASPERPAKDRERDATRRPAEVLEFFGVRPGQTLIEYFAAGGNTAELLARAVGPKGRVYMQNPPWLLERPNSVKAIEERLAGNRLPNVVRVDKPLDALGLKPASVDGAVMNLVFHDMFWLSDDVPGVLEDLHRTLKPGGFVGVVDHAAPEGTGAESAKDRDNGPHRIDEDYSRRAFLDAGFVLEAESDLLRNAEDDRTKPFFAPELKDKTTDRFVLRFRKPKGLADANEPVKIHEFPVPWKDSRPRDPDFVSPTAVWFVGQTGHYVATLNPKTRQFTRIDLDDEPGPHNLIVGRDGIVWYAGNLKGYIGRVDPKTRKIRHIAMPDPDAGDPHTLVFDAGQENIWFTVQAGNFVGRLQVASEKVDLIRVPTAGARPYGIVVARDGRPWIALFGTHKLATVDPKTLALTEHELPRADARPRRLGLTSDGRVWYVDFAEGYLGAFDPASRAVEEWRMPGGEDSRPYAMSVDSRDRIWAVEIGSQPNRFVAFDPGDEKFVNVTPVPSGAVAIRHVDYDSAAGQIWFGTDANTIGYAQVN